jgi:methionyl aminopeptidase
MVSEDVLEKYRKAGEIIRRVREEAQGIIVEDARLLDTAEFIETKIKEYGGGIAFPVNISINEIAAHYSPPARDESLFTRGQYVKIDLGCHIDGYIADTAFTVKVGEEKDTLMRASEEALEAAISIIKVGIKTRDIGEVIQNAITGHGYNPIENLSGHGLAQYTQHAPPTIPNIPQGNEYISEGDIFAIEPFATDGAGKVEDDEKVFIFRFIAPRPLRLPEAKKMMISIQRNYKTLPFAERWVAPDRKSEFYLKTLVRYGVIYPYHILKEVKGGNVTQFEHTVHVTEEGCEVIT